VPEKPSSLVSKEYQPARVECIYAVIVSLSLSILLVAVHEASWIAMLVGVLAGCAVPLLAVSSIMRRQPSYSGPADRITLARAILTGTVATLVVLASFEEYPMRSWWIVLIGGTVLVLDGIDGAVARRTHTATEAGARLDTEIDAAHILVMAAPVAHVVGWWALAIGAMRYGFMAATWFRESLRGSLDHSDFRRAIGLVQGVVLCLVLVPFVPVWLATFLTATSLALLVVSFGRDVNALERAVRRSG